MSDLNELEHQKAILNALRKFTSSRKIIREEGITFKNEIMNHFSDLRPYYGYSYPKPVWQDAEVVENLQLPISTKPKRKRFKVTSIKEYTTTKK